MDAEKWIVGLRRRCVAVRDIALVMGMHPRKVIGVLDSAGALEISAAEARLIGHLYQEDGYSMDALARVSGLDIGTVCKVLRRSGVASRRPGRPGVARCLEDPAALRARFRDVRAA